MKFYNEGPITYTNWEKGPNSLNAVKRRFIIAIHNNIEQIKQAYATSGDKRETENKYFSYETFFFDKTKMDGCKTQETKNCTTAILAKSNLFGLDATIGPEIDKFQLKLNFGRFKTNDVSENSVFPANIDIGKMNLGDRLIYLKNFYNMSNRKALGYFGIKLPTKFDGTVCRFEGCYGYLFASCLLLDSLLKGKQSDVTRIICGKPSEGFYVELSDGTKIKSIINTDEHGKVTPFEGLSISKGEKEATVQFNPFNNQTEGEYFLRIHGGDRQSIGNDIDKIKKTYSGSRETIMKDFTDIDCLDVSDVKYIGDPELIEVLKGAMQEQFESQRENKQNGENIDELGARQILKLMKEKNIPKNALLLAILELYGNMTQIENALRLLKKTLQKDKQKGKGEVIDSN